jgi:hypothetical protein
MSQGQQGQQGQQNDDFNTMQNMFATMNIQNNQPQTAK